MLYVNCLQRPFVMYLVFFTTANDSVVAVKVLLYFTIEYYILEICDCEFRLKCKIEYVS